MRAVALTRGQANEFVKEHHRTHKPVHCDKFRVGAEKDGKLVGVAMVGRPVSRVLDDGKTVEVLRCCTDGTKNACSFLYARASGAAREMGFSRIITYILESEDGASVKASGFQLDGTTKGGSWDTPARRRQTDAPTCKKKRYVKWLR